MDPVPYKKSSIGKIPSIQIPFSAIVPQQNALMWTTMIGYFMKPKPYAVLLLMLAGWINRHQQSPGAGKIIRRERLGGLLKFYRRAA